MNPTKQIITWRGGVPYVKLFSGAYLTIYPHLTTIIVQVFLEEHGVMRAEITEAIKP